MCDLTSDWNSVLLSHDQLTAWISRVAGVPINMYIHYMYIYTRAHTHTHIERESGMFGMLLEVLCGIWSVHSVCFSIYYILLLNEHSLLMLLGATNCQIGPCSEWGVSLCVPPANEVFQLEAISLACCVPTGYRCLRIAMGTVQTPDWLLPCFCLPLLLLSVVSSLVSWCWEVTASLLIQHEEVCSGRGERDVGSHIYW